MAKKLTMILGIILIIAGLLGFISNPLIGENGLFQTDLTHNLVHLVLGLIAVWVATKSLTGTVTYLKVVGIILVILAILGFVASGPLLGFILNNMADCWLHLVIGLIMIWAGFFGSKGESVAM